MLLQNFWGNTSLPPKLFNKEDEQMKETKRVDFWVGIALIALSGAVWLLTAKLPVPKRGIGPGQYPRVIATVMFILGAVQLLTNLKGGFPEKGEPTNWVHLGRALLLAIIAFVYVRLLKFVGFPLLTPFLLFGVIRLFGYKKTKIAILLSIGATAVIFVLFNIVFMVFLPLGILF